MNASFITCPAYTPVISGAPGWVGPRRTRDSEPICGAGLPAFRRTFSCRETPTCVMLEVTALGIYELWCNGERVGRVHDDEVVYDELKPGSTDFRERVFTERYDITPYVGFENTLVAVVAPGWWQGRISFGAFGTAPLAFACEVSVCYAEGTGDTLVTDDSWECTVAGPTLFADIYDGEYTDARMVHPADDTMFYTWTPAIPYHDYHGKVEPRLGPPVRLRPDLERHTVSATLWRKIDDNGTDMGIVRPRMKRVGDGCEAVTVRPGEHLLIDLGQNFAGRPRITLSADCGTVVRLTVAEMLNDSGDRARGNDGPAGSVYVENYRSARADITYVTRGGGQETHTPLYSYYGFRYVDITASETVEIHEVCGEVLTSLMTETGTITTDHALLNRFLENVSWGRRSNYLHVPTDCPQRDERLGWTADTHLFAGAAAYLADIRSFMRKWLLDMRDAQGHRDGAYPDVAPDVIGGQFAGRAAWGDAGIIIPSVLYEMYGDTDIMREHYPSMEAYMDYLARCGHDRSDASYGDWLACEPTDRGYVADAYYIRDARLMAQYSRILSHGTGDQYDRRAAHYESLAARLTDAFRAGYVKGGILSERSQTAYLLALRFHLIDGDTRDAALASLTSDIRSRGCMLTTGFIGTALLANTLSEYGETQLAYSLLLAKHDPSWLYSVAQGATTVWERWNSYTRTGGFGEVSMNSFNHYAYGSVIEWLYRTAAGITTDPDNPGFGHLLLSPMPDLRRGDALPDGEEPLKALSATYDSVAGRIESRWQWQGDLFLWHCTIPQEITATIRFPALTDGILDPTRKNITINHVVYTIGELCGTNRDGIFEFELPTGHYSIY